jgi:hypothetical protein
MCNKHLLTANHLFYLTQTSHIGDSPRSLTVNKPPAAQVHSADVLLLLLLVMVI